MDAFLEGFLTHPAIEPKLSHVRRVPGRCARHGEPREPLPEPLAAALREQGIARLYVHQASALDGARAGRNVLACTPTASGKSLVFALPVLESLLRDPSSKAIFLYPTKALAQDQVAGLRALGAGLGGLRPPRFDLYDGDTPDALRRRIRSDPPEVLVTNPDMLHLGILAHHRSWETFLSRLRFVVLDELHVYRGVFGAHVHHVLRRLKRLCARAGSTPRFIAASATIGNPAEFARALTGEEFDVIAESGAPAAPRRVVFLNPVGVSPYTTAVRVIALAAEAGKRTIAFTKARRVAELLHAWLVRESPALRRRVAPYRAGYLPEERRDIEKRLFRGDLVAVLSTSALELGIDVGGLDVCVLVGYPGSLTSSWQRIGRTGRGDREGLVVLIALPDALDQYLVHHPDLFFGGPFERAVLDPWNPAVARAHLPCAAAEEPLTRTEIEATGDRGTPIVAALEADRRLVRDAAGETWYSVRRRPHRDVGIRSAGAPYAIVDARSGRILGSIDGTRVWHECHPGAIYLHAGQTYRIERLDADNRRVEARAVRVDYYTVVLGDKETEILERLEERSLAGSAPPVRIGLGRLKVTVRIREYQKKRLFDGEPIAAHPLEVPPLVFETVGFWVEVPASLPRALSAEGLHPMGALHAAEHAAIGLFPLLAIADRGDVGGISYTGHPQVGGPAVFVYDGVEGGAGLAEQGYRRLEDLLRRTRDLVRECACEEGCPSCIQSPRCGNGNKPLDKAGAVRLLDVLVGEVSLPEAAKESVDVRSPSAMEPTPALPRRKHGITRAGNVAPGGRPSGTTLVFDLETQRSAEEVGGWGHASRMGLAVAVVYDLERATYLTYFEEDVNRLLLDLALADRVVGFNIVRFDLPVLSAYTGSDLTRLRTLDLLDEIRRALGFRLSLGHLSEVNLGEAKTGDGLKSLAWWREGRRDMVEHYCRKDVEITWRLYTLGRERGYLLYRDREGRSLRVPVAW